MTTALDLIQDSLEMLGVYGPGDAISAADSARSLIVLNDMLDSWSNDAMTCFAWLQQSFALAVNITQYTCGPGGTVSNVRPLRVSDSAGAAYILDQNNNKYPMDVVDQLTYNLRTTAAVNSNLPDTLFYDPQFPLGIVNIWPTPSEIFEVYFFSYLQLAEFATIYTAVSLPPGYNLAIKTNLAVALKPYFTSAQLDPIIIKRAAESLGSVKRNNNRTQRSIYEPEIIARGQSTYNIRSDRNY